MPASILNALNVAIVFCVVFFLMSTLASHLTEVLSGFFNSRGTTLRKQLSAALSRAVADEILNDPVIRAFSKGSRGSAGADPASGAAKAASVMPSYITPASFARAVTQSFGNAASASAKSDVLQELMDDAQHRKITFETTITEWFAQFNDRIAGTYRRYTTIKLFALGFIAAVALDIDVVHLGAYLWANPATTSGTADQIAAIFAKIGGTASAPDVQSLANEGKDLTQALTSNLGVGAFGWQQSHTPSNASASVWWAAKVLGWLLAAVATSFGAQFWFQLLSNGLKIRLTGKRPNAPTSAPDSDKPDQTAAGGNGGHAAAPQPQVPAPPAVAASGSSGMAGAATLASFVTSAAQPPLLGSLSSKYEVGNRGPGTVSSGAGDPGGVSYGSYQMTSLPDGGTVKAFVAQLPVAQRASFGGHMPGSTEFTAAWKQLAQADPSSFFIQQHDYIRVTHYEPLCRTVAAIVDIAARSFALQNVVWSTAVQHGAQTPILSLVVGKFDFGGYKGAANELDGLVIEAIYAERGRKLPDGRLVYFTKCSAQVQASVAQRFVDEQRDALQMLAKESEPTSLVAQADEYAV